MEGFLSHTSALEFCRAGYQLSDYKPSRSEQRAAILAFKRHVPRVSPLDCEALALHGLKESPVSLLVPSGSARRHPPGTECHVWSTPLPRNPFVSVAPGIWCSSPGFTFAQMAQQLELARLVLLGYELCGTYALAPHELAPGLDAWPFDDGAGQASGRDLSPDYRYPFEGGSPPAPGFIEAPSRTTAAQLAGLAHDVAGANGAKRVAAASALVANGAASPMESALAMLLTMPMRLGGYGFCLPEMNARIDFDQRAHGMTSRQYLVCDLYWPSARVALEYDSNGFHTGPSQIARDSIRRNALAYEGIEAISVTWAQIVSPTETDRIAHLLARRLGRRLRNLDLSWEYNRDELRRIVLPGQR